MLRALRLCDSESGRILKADLEKDVEAAQAVRRVLSAPPSAHYSVMNLRPGCSAAELKKQYKVLSLELHPDRNHTDGAEDAFKRLSGAFEALSKRVGEPQHYPNGSTRGTASSQQHAATSSHQHAATSSSHQQHVSCDRAV